MFILISSLFKIFEGASINDNGRFKKIHPFFKFIHISDPDLETRVQIRYRYVLGICTLALPPHNCYAIIAFREGNNNFKIFNKYNKII